MLSSTSNSNDRIPAANWRKVWVLALALFVAALSGWEGFWRWQGFHRRPSEGDAKQWALMRKEASRKGTKAVVLIGSSRILTDIDTEVFMEASGVNPIQLGISATTPFPVLQNLADDPSFNGTVICDFHEVYVYASNPTNPSQVKSSPDEFLKAYEERTFLEDLLPTQIEMQGRKFLKETFVFQMKELSFSNVIYHLTKSKLPQKPEEPKKVGRAIGSDVFQDSEIERLRKYFEETTINFINKGSMSRDKLPEIIEKIEQAVAKIQRRGGKVILVCLPMSGKLWEINEQHFPKKEYWDVLAANTSARAIHFTDYPSLAGYICDEGSHLNRKNAATFTKSLVEILYGNNGND